MQNKKRMKTMIAATAMIGVLAIGGISAYFTDGDTATNTFTEEKYLSTYRSLTGIHRRISHQTRRLKRILRSRMMVSMMHTCL